MPAPNDDDRNWDAATYEGAELARVRDGLKMSFEEKLDWLEEAQKLVENIQREPPADNGRHGQEDHG